MRDSDDGSAKAEASPVASPSASPQHSTQGPPAPYSQIPAPPPPHFEGPSSAAKLPAPPRSHLVAPPAAQTPAPAPTPPPGRRAAVGLGRGPRKPRAGGRTGRPARPHPHAGDGAARRPPGKDKSCSTAGRAVPGSPRPPPRWPPTRPPFRLPRGPGLHSPDGFREEAASLGPCTPDLLHVLRSHSPLLRVSWPVEVAPPP